MADVAGGADAPPVPASEQAPPSETPAVSEKKSRGCCRGTKCTWPCFKAFLLKNFLVIGLVTAIIFAIAIPWPGRAINSVKVGSWRVFSTINIITIFIISGLTLQTDHVKDAVRQWLAALAGTISILLITPCAAFLLVQLPFNPPAYRYGLAIFALVPTTIASGVTLVTSARGNAALALMLTIITNVLAVFILPFTVPLVISQAQSVSIDSAQFLIKLVMTILVPLIIGKILRDCSAWVRRQVAKHKVGLGLLSNGSLICTVWLTLSSAQTDVINTPFGTLCLIFLAAILLHIAYLIVNFIIVTVLRLPHREAAAVLIMGSEKTLPMAVTVIAATGTALGSSGQLTVPCVLAHISQVLIDAFLCDYLGKREKKKTDKSLPQINDCSSFNTLVELSNGAANGGGETAGETNGNGSAATAPPVTVESGAEPGSEKSSADESPPIPPPTITTILPSNSKSNV